jgi:16S rRNA (cytosine1402-N4)-methyltransferase
MPGAKVTGETTMRWHRPVLLQQAVSLLNCSRGGLYVDGTVGLGGHGERILELSSPTGFLLGLDRDQEALELADEKLRRFSGRYRLVHCDYREMRSVLQNDRYPAANGLMLDLGVSMLQFGTAERGFSFMLEGPLDMRMDRSQRLTAEEIVQDWDEKRLATILYELGEEKASRRIARRIVDERKRRPIATTGRLREVVESVLPRRPQQKIHPATRTFQALRMAVNAELDGLDQFVFDAFDSLAEGGRMAVIAFHSLEDRIFKQAFQFLSAACRCSKRQVICGCGGEPLSKLLTRKPVTPEEDEVRDNPASRSAKLRAIEKIRGNAPRELWEEWHSALKS